jgi:hypothetical protein
MRQTRRHHTAYYHVPDIALRAVASVEHVLRLDVAMYDHFCARARSRRARGCNHEHASTRQAVQVDDCTGDLRERAGDLARAERVPQRPARVSRYAAAITGNHFTITHRYRSRCCSLPLAAPTSACSTRPARARHEHRTSSRDDPPHTQTRAHLISRRASPRDHVGERARHQLGEYQQSPVQRTIVNARAHTKSVCESAHSYTTTCTCPYEFAVHL